MNIVPKSLDEVIDHLSTHGWEPHGLSLKKGEEVFVILRTDGVIEYRGDGPCPPELLAFLDRGSVQ